MEDSKLMSTMATPARCSVPEGAARRNGSSARGEVADLALPNALSG